MQNSSIIRIAFDTNIWISFSIGKRLDMLKEILPDKKIKVLFVPKSLKNIFGFQEVKN